LKPAELRLAAASAGIPRDESEPVFAAPWQAQAFAIAVHMVETGRITLAEWAEALGAEIAKAGSAASPETYYRHWLDALETLAHRKSLALRPELVARQQAWRDAAEATPHGEPIMLARLAASRC
jgi:nitrile hydratase accessory protein